MALYSVIKAEVDDEINTNGIQYITGAIHNDVLNNLIDAVGAAQFFAFPSGGVAHNPGTPQNPRAYLVHPGIYTNFGGLEITAPLGVLFWDGTSWSATQLTIPHAYEYRMCRTTQARSFGTPYTSVTVDMNSFGWNALAGQWVQLINRETGGYDFVQLTADLSDTDVSMTFRSRVLQVALPIYSIVEIDPQVNMAMYGIKRNGDGINTYITVPSDWLLPPIQTVDEDLWVKLIDIRINGKECYWKASPVSPFEFRVDASFPLRIYFAEVLETTDVVTVRYQQPRILTIIA